MTSEQIKELIDRLLETGEILASKAFELAVRQVYVDAIGASALFIVLTVLACFLWKWFRDDDEPVIVVAAVMAHAFSLGFLYEAIGMLINPEWYAIKLLMHQFIK